MQKLLINLLEGDHKALARSISLVENEYTGYEELLSLLPANLSTPVIGKMEGREAVIFSISRYKTINAGLLVALRKSDGKEIWKLHNSNYAWSSPLDLYDPNGNMYIFLADSGGNVMLVDGADGRLIYKVKIANLFEASPVAFNDKIIIPSRPHEIFCVEIQ